MKILIVAEKMDTDALLVKIALERVGYSAALLCLTDLPSKLLHSAYLENNYYQWNSANKYHQVLEPDYDVVWWRRPHKPQLPQGIIHPEDYQFVERENCLFSESLTSTIGYSAWWINSKAAARKASAKILQLKLANQCGMNIPTTLCSNNPKDIRHFLLKHGPEGVIYKPLCSNFWLEKEEIKISYTTKVEFLDLPNNRLLQYAPGIFQKEVPKKYEVRIVCFGDYIVAAKLHSQDHPEGRIDWRAIPAGKMRVEPYALNPTLMVKLRSFMHRMGLVFGSCDFVVTPDNEYVFLEINEQGQFLWLEEYNPELKMLDMFVNFIRNGSPKFNWDSRKFTHTILQYKKEMEYTLDGIQADIN